MKKIFFAKLLLFKIFIASLLNFLKVLLLLEKIFEHFYPKNKNFLFEDVIKWLEENPEIFKLNSMVKPNLGWVKSLEEDKKRGFSR